jgi:hypothetical protein
MTDEYLPAESEQEEELKAPFSFKLMIVLTVVYLGWRLIQGIMWLVERLT